MTMYVFLVPLLLPGAVQCGRDQEALNKIIGKRHTAYLTATGRVGRAVLDDPEPHVPKKAATNEDDPEASGYYFEDTDTHAAKIKSVVGRVTSEADSAASKARKVSQDLNIYMKKLNELFSQLAVMTEKQNAYVAKINADALAEEGPRNQPFEDLDKELRKKNIGASKQKVGSLEQKTANLDQQVHEDEVERLRAQIQQLQAAASVGNRATSQKSLAKSAKRHGSHAKESLLEKEERTDVADIGPSEEEKSQDAISEIGEGDQEEEDNKEADELHPTEDEDGQDDLGVASEDKEQPEEVQQQLETVTSMVNLATSQESLAKSANEHGSLLEKEERLDAGNVVPSDEDKTQDGMSEVKEGDQEEEEEEEEEEEDRKEANEPHPIEDEDENEGGKKKEELNEAQPTEEKFAPERSSQ